MSKPYCYRASAPASFTLSLSLRRSALVVHPSPALSTHRLVTCHWPGPSACRVPPGVAPLRRQLGLLHRSSACSCTTLSLPTASDEADPADGAHQADQETEARHLRRRRARRGPWRGGHDAFARAALAASPGPLCRAWCRTTTARPRPRPRPRLPTGPGSPPAKRLRRRPCPPRLGRLGPPVVPRPCHVRPRPRTAAVAKRQRCAKPTSPIWPPSCTAVCSRETTAVPPVHGACC